MMETSLLFLSQTQIQAVGKLLGYQNDYNDDGTSKICSTGGSCAGGIMDNILVSMYYKYKKVHFCHRKCISATEMYFLPRKCTFCHGNALSVTEMHFQPRKCTFCHRNALSATVMTFCHSYDFLSQL